MRKMIAVCLVIGAACGSKKDDKGASGAGSGPGSSAAGAGGSAVTAPAGGSGAAAGSGPGAAGAVKASAPMPGVEPGRKTRIFECGFVKVDGEGKKRKTVFKLKNLGEAQAEGAQSWIYYYDSSGKLLARYPHRFSTNLGPGAVEDQALGHAGDSIPKDAAVFECEVSDVDWKDKTRWSNANLSSHAIDRPRGGFTHEQLMAREGEAVTATWGGKVDGGPVLELHNVSGRPLTAKVVWVYQYDEAGKQLERSVNNVSIDLEPGAKLEKPFAPAALKAGAKVVEAVVSEVRFRDGEKEQWLNDNLVPLGGRAMKAKITGTGTGSGTGAGMGTGKQPK